MNEPNLPRRHQRKPDGFPRLEFAIVLSCLALALVAIVVIIISVS